MVFMWETVGVAANDVITYFMKRTHSTYMSKSSMIVSIKQSFLIVSVMDSSSHQLAELEKSSKEAWSLLTVILLGAAITLLVFAFIIAAIARFNLSFVCPIELALKELCFSIGWATAAEPPAPAEAGETAPW